MVRSVLKWMLVSMIAAFSIGAYAEPREGKDYLMLSPAQNTDAPGKIEVVEFFWYGCPHCYALEPLIEPWAKKLPRDVVFRRVPAMFNDNWAAAGRVYYTLEAMGEVDRLHKPLFDAIHKDNLRITSDSALKDWLEKNKVDVKKFETTAKSFSVESKMRRAAQMTESYKFDGVPAIAVNGRFVALSSQAGSPQTLLTNTDYLIGLARQDGAKSAAKN